MQVDALITELLATGQMNEDTTTELNRLLAEAQAGTIDPDDEAYVRALHARITGAEAPPADDLEPATPYRVEGLTAEEWRDRALRAEEELAVLKDSLPGATAP